MASEREVKVKFTGEGSSVQSAARDIRQVFQALMDDTDDVRTAGAKMETAYKMVASGMRKDMASVDEAVELLKDSLGPEMAAKLDQAGVSIEKQIGEWRKLGLTLDDIKMDSDSLATGLLDLDDAARRGTGSVGDGMRKVAGETEQTRSVMANFVGNAVQELPGMGAAFGPLNMAMGQFAEYATEGNISMKNFLTAAGGMAAVTVGFQLLSAGIKALGADEREMKARTAEVVDAMDDQVRSTWELAAASSEAGGKIDGLAAANRALSNGLLQAGDDGKKLRLALGEIGLTGDDALETLVKLKDDPVAALRALALQSGATAEQAEKLAQKVNETDKPFWGASEANRWLTDDLKRTGQAMEELQDQAEKTDLESITREFLNSQASANDAAGAMVRLAEANTSAADGAGSAFEAYKEFNRLLGEADAATRDAVLGSKEYEAVQRKLADARRDSVEALEAEVRALDAARVAAEQQLSGEMAAIDSQFSLRSAQENTTKAIQASTLAQLDGNRTTEEKAAAEQAAVQAAWNLAKAQLRLAEDQATANRQVLSGGDKQRILRDSLQETGQTLAPGAPLRTAIGGLIKDINSVPTSKQTEFSTSGIGGMLGGGLSGSGVLGEIGAVKRALDGVKDKHVTVTADTSNIERALQRVIAKAGEAERAVGRVAT